MRLLVTAGNTQAPVDRVRVLTNIFSGRTGAAIALHAYEQGHHVTLLTSHPDAVLELGSPRPLGPERWRPHRYRTFADLQNLMAAEIRGGGHDAVVHTAAVNDYESAGVYAPAPGTHFDEVAGTWSGSPPALLDRAAGKVKSDEPELWLRLRRSPKLIDQVRRPWGFPGVLVKFKLEVGITQEQLLEVAERSRRHSDADLMVANTLEGAHEWALLGPFHEAYERIERRDLPRRLLAAVEAKGKERSRD
jgi:phosphopantothenoylcysteine synthetase/decarboxylase